jgi:hypothetical protein
LKSILAVFLITAVPLFSVSIEDFIGQGNARILTEKGVVTEIQLKNPRPSLMPNHAALRELMADIQKSLAPGIMVESLYRYAKPVGASWDSWTASEKRALYNETLAISTLKGIEYYSTSRKTMRIFYDYSTVIDSPVSKQPRPDPAFDEVPAELVVYARQRDLSFGDNIYRYDYYAKDNAFIFVQQNLTAMNYGIIPALARNKLRSLVAVIDSGDSLLVYAASMAKAASFPGMGEKVGNSFSTRAEAILKWFSDRADRAFAAR